jgi:hypothetical protein
MMRTTVALGILCSSGAWSVPVYMLKNKNEWFNQYQKQNPGRFIINSLVANTLCLLQVIAKASCIVHYKNMYHIHDDAKKIHSSPFL